MVTTLRSTGMTQQPAPAASSVEKKAVPVVFRSLPEGIPLQMRGLQGPQRHPGCHSPEETGTREIRGLGGEQEEKTHILKGSGG